MTSYLTLERGTRVVDRFGADVGRVERVLTIDHEYFDGLVVATPVGRRFVDAPDVERIDEDEVRLHITCADVDQPGDGPRTEGFVAARHDRTEATDDDRRECIDALKQAYCDDLLGADELGDRIERVYETDSLDVLEGLLPG